MSDEPGGRPRELFIAAVLAVAVVGVIVAAVAINRGNNSSREATATATPGAAGTEAATPPPATTPTPPAQVAFADCGGVQFGAPLAPQNPPADVHKYPSSPPMQIDTSKLYEAIITTARGAIVLCLQPTLAPATVNNFVALARNHFFDGLTFHRVEAGFVIQGGDPQGTGQGGPGYQFADEPVHQQYVDGAVAMANSGPNTNGSQFFIDSADDTAKLQPQYNLFGKVQSGLDVVHRIAKGDVMTTVTVAQQQ